MEPYNKIEVTMNGVKDIKVNRRIKYYLLRLFRLKESPNQVALGVMLGFAPNWFPTFGLGPILSIGIAKLARVNVVAAIIGGVIGSPLWPILFLMNYRMGSMLYQKPSNVNDVDDIDYIEAVNDTVGSLHSGSLTFLIGSVVNVIIFSILLYIVVFLLFKKYRLTILRKLSSTK